MKTYNDLCDAMVNARQSGKMREHLDAILGLIDLITAGVNVEADPESDASAAQELDADRIVSEDRLLEFDAPFGLLEYDPTF